MVKEQGERGPKKLQTGHKDEVETMINKIFKKGDFRNLPTGECFLWLEDTEFVGQNYCKQCDISKHCIRINGVQNSSVNIRCGDCLGLVKKLDRGYCIDFGIKLEVYDSLDRQITHVEHYYNFNPPVKPPMYHGCRGGNMVEMKLIKSATYPYKSGGKITPLEYRIFECQQCQEEIAIWNDEKKLKKQTKRREI